MLPPPCVEYQEDTGVTIGIHKHISIKFQDIEEILLFWNTENLSFSHLRKTSKVIFDEQSDLEVANNGRPGSRLRTVVHPIVGNY